MIEVRVEVCVGTGGGQRVNLVRFAKVPLITDTINVGDGWVLGVDSVESHLDDREVLVTLNPWGSPDDPMAIINRLRLHGFKPVGEVEENSLDHDSGGKL